jgi:hypothetical protein
MKPIFYFLVALLLSQSTLAATLTVTNGNDAGIGSLRNAITSANAGDNIVFSGVTNVNLTSGALFIDKNLSIDGGASGVTIMRVSVTQFRIFTIQSGSTVSMTKLTITNGNDPGQAGGLQNNGTLTMTDCVVSQNQAGQAGGLQNDGVLTMTNCTVADNTEGGLVIYGASTTLTNCTFTGNEGVFGGAIISGGTGTTLTLTNCTITQNRAEFGGGMVLNPATVLLKNTICINNTALSDANIRGSVSSASSYNLIGVDGTGGMDGTGGLINGENNNQVGVSNAYLSSVGSYGGYGQTIALLPGSPAINAGTAVDAPTTDQRGTARVGATDIGAFESRGFTMSYSSGDNQTTLAKTAFPHPLAVTVSSLSNEPINGGGVTFTPPGSGASTTIAGNPALIVGGVATTGQLTANVTAGGPYTVTATALGASPGINFSLTNTPNAPDYAITTVGGHLVITDLKNVGETIVMSETGANLRLEVTGKSYSLDGANPLDFPFDMPISGLQSITINAEGGNDKINFGAFTQTLPTLTVNGGTGNDRVYFEGDITFAANANLDLNLQNDDADPGEDEVEFDSDLRLSGSGAVTVKVSKEFFSYEEATLETVDGDITIEVNQQPVPLATAQTLNIDYSIWRATGRGNITLKAKTISTAPGLMSISSVLSTQSGHINLQAESGSDGFYGTPSITTAGGNITITTTGNNIGFNLFYTTVSAGGMGNVNINAQGRRTGVELESATITSAGGNVTVNGTTNGTYNDSRAFGVDLRFGSRISAGGMGTVTVAGTAGNPGTANDYGIELEDYSQITSSGGNVNITAIGNASSKALEFQSGSITTATNGGNITLITDDANIGANATIATNADGSVTLRQRTNNNAIDLGGNDVRGTTLGLTDAELDRINTPRLLIGDANSGPITISQPISRTAATALQLTTASQVRPATNGNDLSNANLRFGNGTDARFVINGITPDTQYEQLNVVGTVNLTGADLVFSTSNAFVPTVGQTFTIINNDEADAITGTFNGLSQGATINNFLGGSLNATISYTGGTGNDVVITVQAAPLPDYRITTTNNAIIITDISGNGETFDVSESGSNISFNVAGRTFSLDGGATTAFPADVALADISSITINAEGGNDIINFGAFTQILPTLTVNGGIGNDRVYFNGDITFAANANLDLDLQNDDANPGEDGGFFEDDIDLRLSGSGAVIIKVNTQFLTGDNTTLETVNGDITIEGNQQAVPNLNAGRIIISNSTFRSTGSGNISFKSKTFNNSADGVVLWGTTVSTQSGHINLQGDVTGNRAIDLSNSNITTAGGNIVLQGTSSAVYGFDMSRSVVSAGGMGTVNITGQGQSYGVLMINSTITSAGGDVAVSGTATAGTGINLNFDNQISAGGMGTVTVTGTGGNTSQGGRGIQLEENDRITSSGGNVTISGTGGTSAMGNFNHGINLINNIHLSAGGMGTLTITAQGGNSPGNDNYSLYIQENNNEITSGGGNIQLTAIGGNATSKALELSAGTITTATNGGNITIIADDANIGANATIATNADGSVTLRQRTNNNAIDLGGNDVIGTTLGLTDAELDRINTPRLLIGDANSGPITISQPISRTAATALQLTTASQVRPATNGNDLSNANLRFGNGTDARFVINGITPDTQYEQLNVVGTVNLTGADLVFSTSNAFVPTVGQTFTIINNDEADAITGTFNGLSEGGTISNFLGSGLNAAISYRGGTGNDVVLTIRSLPTATVSGGGTVCLGQPLPNVSIVLTGTPPWSITYSNGTSSTSIPVINVSPYVITEAGPGTYTVTAVSNSDGVGISMVGSAVVAVTPLPVVSITQSTLCTGLILNQNYYVVFFK